ncbi:MAG: DUF4037 domain-containing protein [Spirochaetaceae bacterium]|nr:MAG: DUF4037 domain-containing protein [Spirochaetaceae bacterium]
MKGKIDRAVKDLVGRISSWPAVDTVAMVESGEDLYDPYFFISFDVYCTAAIPDESLRRTIFEDAVAFESLQSNRKDRFLLRDIPFRIEYKDLRRFNEIINAAKTNEVVQRDSGTYMFYRLKHSQIMYQKSDWIDEVRKDLDALNDRFWDGLRASLQARMEHFLGDLHAAVVRGDSLFFIISAAGFIRSLFSVLFAINHCFEPSARSLYEQARTLPILPEPFAGRLESFLRSESSSMTPERRKEVAELMAKSVLAL